MHALTTTARTISRSQQSLSAFKPDAADATPHNVGLSVMINAAITLYFMVNAAAMVFLLITRHSAAWNWITAATKQDRDIRNVWRFGCGLVSCFSVLTIAAAILL